MLYNLETGALSVARTKKEAEDKFCTCYADLPGMMDSVPGIGF